MIGRRTYSMFSMQTHQNLIQSQITSFCKPFDFLKLVFRITYFTFEYYYYSLFDTQKFNWYIFIQIMNHTVLFKFIFVFYVQLWDVRDGNCKQTFTGHESDINAVTVRIIFWFGRPPTVTDICMEKYVKKKRYYCVLKLFLSSLVWIWILSFHTYIY